jgi:hypothetical protein
MNAKLNANRLRSRRKRIARPRTIKMSRISKVRIVAARIAEPDDGLRRLPMTRGDCAEFERPCPYISCKNHLFADVDYRSGSIKFNFPDLFDADGAPELDLMPCTCALDVADAGGATLEKTGEYMNLTRERVRQIVALIAGAMREWGDVRDLARLFGMRADGSFAIDLSDEDEDVARDGQNEPDEDCLDNGDT